jgi:hypothetical protein
MDIFIAFGREQLISFHAMIGKEAKIDGQNVSKVNKFIYTTQVAVPSDWNR